jgi:hypothetical protein
MLEPSALVLPDLQAFRRYLRIFGQRTMRTVIEPLMREEPDALSAVALTYAQKRSGVTR